MCCDPSINLSFPHFPAAQPYRDIPQLPIALPCFSSSSIYGCFCLLGVNVPSPKCPSFSKLLSAFTVSGVSLNILDGFHLVGEKHFPCFFHLQVRACLLPESRHADVKSRLWSRPHDRQRHGGGSEDGGDHAVRHF